MFFFTVFLFIVACIAALIYLSDRTENKALKWTGIIVPPLSTLYLITVPIDLVTSLIWLPAWLLMVYSVLRLVFILARDIFRYVQSKKKNIFSKDLVPVVRPGLYITTYFIAHTLVVMSTVSANAKAIELSFEMKEYVVSNKSCRETIPEWGPPSPYDDDLISMSYGEYGTEYRISYFCDLEKGEFRYRVRVNHDALFQITTKFDGTMVAEYGHYSNRKVVEVDESTDLKSLAKMKLHEKNET